VGQVELGELPERALDLRARAKLERSVLACDGAPVPDRGLRQPPGLLPRLAEELRSGARLAELLYRRHAAAAVVRIAAPGVDRRVRRPQPPAQHGALEPVDAVRGGHAGRSQVGEQVARAPAPDRGFQQRDQAGAGHGASDCEVRLHSHRDLEPGEHAAVDRTG
jgi:hypothetical protein